MKISESILSSRFLLTIVFVLGLFVLIGIGKVAVDQIPEMWPLLLSILGYQASETSIKIKNGNGAK